ncbi:hypothetical protein J2T12_004080 [Paenibacillus anaericanus]|uniref:hypothetical protein n=1 Tax=Paenibacillus anaericanus TaxID=170367 RepID=UPI00278707A1|nr:hypothetical protein [Paenibacillus anaericanus]MDQ0090657.1 hypothetical protein [Paenibacillus anaericanus]
MKKICFAILVHNYKEALKDMVDNIRHFCPHSSIVLYNGGDDPELCKGLGLPICPTSKKLVYPTSISTYMSEVMKWLIDSKYEFDYLINLDSDCLFAKQGFEQFVDKEMNNSDYMGVRVRVPTDNWIPYQNFQKEWVLWKSVFKQDELLCCFNVGQIFSKQLVGNIVKISETYQIKQKLLQTRSKGIVEIVYVSLAHKLGARIKPYPIETASSIRFRPHFTADEIKKCLQNNPYEYLFHPVYRDMHNETRTWIRTLI